MKALIFTFLFAFCSVQFLGAQVIQTVTMVANQEQNIVVPSGQVIEFVSFLETGTTSGNPQWTLNGIPFQTSHPGTGQTLAGPLTINVKIDLGSSAKIIFNYRMKPNAEVATADVASQIVVIPQNASAPADIILESSTDLITWTAALPGSYSPAASNRFFRVRVVTH